MGSWISNVRRGVPMAALVACALPAFGMDAGTAELLLKENKCTKCHELDRKKDGPAYRDVAAKYRGEADASAKIIHHMTAGDRVKFPDGHEEKHKKLKTDSPADVNGLAQWLLSLEGGKKY